MIAVIFEIWAANGRVDDYLALAARLRSALESMDGFVSIERYQSLSEPGKYLSLSFWRDEVAVAQWRQMAAHRLAQSAGRAGGHLRRLPAAGGHGATRLRYDGKNAGTG